MSKLDLEKLAASSLVEVEGEMIFSKEHYAYLIMRECLSIAQEYDYPKLSGPGTIIANRIYEHFRRDK